MHPRGSRSTRGSARSPALRSLSPVPVLRAPPRPRGSQGSQAAAAAVHHSPKPDAGPTGPPSPGTTCCRSARCLRAGLRLLSGVIGPEGRGSTRLWPKRLEVPPGGRGGRGARALTTHAAHHTHRAHATYTRHTHAHHTHATYTRRARHVHQARTRTPHARTPCRHMHMHTVHEYVHSAHARTHTHSKHAHRTHARPWGRAGRQLSALYSDCPWVMGRDFHFLPRLSHLLQIFDKDKL